MKTVKKVCIVCNEKPARQKFCAECRREQTLKRLALRWKSDQEYRERHKVTARLSFRRRHVIETTEE